MPGNNSKKIYIASDHAGFELKGKLIDYLEIEGYIIQDMGAHSYDEADDYPDFVSLVAREVSDSPVESLGVVIGGSGQGEAMVCNRFPNVRASVYYGGNLDVVKTTRQHNDSNVLSLGARFMSEEEAESALKIWLETDFSGEERHIRRHKKIEELKNVK
ncbi:MAG: RpiB/LacA/LacB family sugar-phosphate isomerase [bacterium]|nr:RpiB/LacA/LacB family sugar-phosphate isomerase [bacterium]